MEKATSFYCFRDIVSELLNILNEAEADNSGLLRVKPKPIPAEVQVEEEPALEPSPSQMQNRSPTAKRDLWSVVTRSSRKSIAAHTMEDERKRLMSHRPSVNGNMGSIMDMPRTASLGSTALPNAGARGNGNLEQQQQQQQPPQSSNGGGIFSSTTLPRALRRRPTQVDERLLEDVPPVPAIPTLPKLPSQGEGVDTDGSAMTSVTSEVVRESTYEPNGMPTIDDTSNTDLADRKFSVTRPSAIITASGTLETTADGAGLEGSTPTTPADQLGFCEKAKLGMTKLNTSHSMANLFELIVPHEFHNLPSSTRNNVGAGGAGPSSSGFDPLTVISSQYASKLRVSQLSDLLTHIINAISASNPMALVLQEAQWLDNSSWDLLWDIINACHKVVVFIFTRPESYIENEECKAMLHKFKRLPRATSIAMGGLTVSETKEMIKSMFGTIVSDVGAHLAQKIHDRTGGNPLYIQSLVVALREAGQLRVDELGNLTIVGAAEKSGFDIEHMVLGYDLQSIILAQFDRLDRIFQLFLKVAAVLGQRFLVDDVMYFLSDLPGVKELFKRQIAKKVDTMDKYGFLQRVEADGNIGSGAGEASVLHYQFKSVMVRNCIYSMMVLSQRQQLHLIVALYYEKKIKQNEDNRHRLLIPLFEHYMEAGDNYRMKKIKYLSEVAHYYHDHHWPVETIKHYLMLMQTAEAVQADTGQIFFDHVKVAGWYRELGEAYFWKGDTETAERHLQESLWLLGYKVPQTSLSLWWRVRKEMSARSFYNYGVMNNDSSASYLPFAHLLSHKKDGDGKKDTSASSIGGVSKFFFDTNRRATGGSSGNSIEPQSTGGAGGTSGGLASPSGNVLSMDSSGAVARSTQVSANASGCSFTPGGANPSHLPLPSTQQDTSELDLRELISKDPKMELLHNVRLCYLTLAQIYLQTDQPKHHKYCVIKGLNISEQFPRTGLYGRFMAMAGARFWMHARRRNTALRYLEAATKYERTNGDVTNATYTTQHITQTLFLMGVWKVSIDKLELLISLCTLSGDFASRENALRTKSIQLFITGPRSSSLHTARELYGLSVQEDHWLGKFWGLWLIVANLLDLSASTPSSPNPPTGRPVSMIFSPTTSLLPGGPNRPVDLMTELTENFEAWQKVMGEIPSKYKELKHLRVLELGLLSKYELRMGRPVNSIELATELYGLLKDLMQPPIITTTSWIPTLGIFLALRSFFVAYDNGWISDRAVQTAVRKFCRLCCKWLSKITYWCMAEPLRRIVESLACLCSNRKWSAVKALKAGLDIKDVDDIVVVSAVLHMLVGRHEERRPDGRDHLGTARTMFRMLGATYEMERTEVEGNKI
ncbi:hypothetical protein BC832DRAFT_128121 [Gaertneriomyces semiglobifer]|nr:hypothetical protein BC832DRAFT_128121 [Gaertneriomyces semiglobifer]